jgi:ArsR family transcriptional regulator, arsenate/arsenite/antimonite-responsive transcriptional repressor
MTLGGVGNQQFHLLSWLMGRIVISGVSEMTIDTLRTLADRMKVLAHPARLRILAMLKQGELCVCQIAGVLEGPSSTVSEHLQSLRRAGFLLERREGKWVHYRLPESGPETDLLEGLWPLLKGEACLQSDRTQARQLKRTLKTGVCAANR